MKNNKKRLFENEVRTILRREIKKILEAEEENKDTAEEKPTEEPEEAPEDEGLDRVLTGLTNQYVRKLKDSSAEVNSDTLSDMIGEIIESFMDSSEQKLSVLKMIKTKIVR